MSMWIESFDREKNKNRNDCDSYLFYFHNPSFIYIITLTLISQRYSQTNSCTIKIMKYCKIYTIYIKYKY